MSNFASTPKPPYYAVIFTNQRTETDEGYGETAEHMVSLAAKQPGYLGVESVRNASGFGVTISYWESLEAIRNWKANEAHLIAQEKGQKVWYENYTTRVCKVEREYSF